jgi:hypothetical protein
MDYKKSAYRENMSNEYQDVPVSFCMEHKKGALRENMSIRMY